MARYLRIQRFGEPLARVLPTKDVTQHIVDAILRRRLEWLAPGESVHTALATYESADCPHCLGEGSTYSADDDRNHGCEACDETGHAHHCVDCGDQISPDLDRCESCESAGNDADDSAYARAAS